MKTVLFTSVSPELLARVVAGQAHALDELFRLAHGDLVRLARCRRLNLDPRHCEDAAQEVWLRMSRGALPSFRPADGHTVGSYLWNLLRNSATSTRAAYRAPGTLSRMRVPGRGAHVSVPMAIADDLDLAHTSAVRLDTARITREAPIGLARALAHIQQGYSVARAAEQAGLTRMVLRTRLAHLRAHYGDRRALDGPLQMATRQRDHPSSGCSSRGCSRMTAVLS